MAVLCLIPARGGSRRIPRKNLRLLGGKPLIAHSIEHALAARSIGRTIVSTDDAETAGVARQYGAEVPFIRPAEISGEGSTDLETFDHALGWLRQHEGYVPDICVHLRPTYPLRAVEDIDRMVAILKDSPKFDSVRSVAPAAETPFKMWFRDQSGLLSPAVNPVNPVNNVTSDIQEPHNLPRQRLPEAFLQNAAIDVVWTRVITGMKSMTGRAIYGYIMDANFDIDTESDLERASRILADRESSHS